MRFKESPYYNEKLLGKNLYERFIINNTKIFTVKEFFNINSEQKQYKKEIQYKSLYVLKIYDEYYELYSYDDINYGYIAFDKPVHIKGKCCSYIIAPVIIIKSKKNDTISYCVADKVVIDSDYENFYYIVNSKINSLYFYNPEVCLNNSEIKNFFVLNQELIFDVDSKFLNYHKIRCFGKNDDLKENLLKNENFKNRIIHIE